MFVGCVQRTVGEMVGCARSRTLDNPCPSSGPVRVTHHCCGAFVLHPPYAEKRGVGLLTMFLFLLTAGILVGSAPAVRADDGATASDLSLRGAPADSADSPAQVPLDRRGPSSSPASASTSVAERAAPQRLFSHTKWEGPAVVLVAPRARFAMERRVSQPATAGRRGRSEGGANQRGTAAGRQPAGLAFQLSQDPTEPQFRRAACPIAGGRASASGSNRAAGARPRGPAVVAATACRADQGGRKLRFAAGPEIDPQDRGRH